MLAHVFSIEQLVDLVRAGLATATPQRVRAGGKAIEVAVLRITRRAGKHWRGRSDEVHPLPRYRMGLRGA